jgi:ABC-2 type transport system ATP-binding protein
VEKLCDQLVMLKNGKMVLNGAVQKIQESYTRTRLMLESPLNKQNLLAIDGVQTVKQEAKDRYYVILNDPKIALIVWQKAMEKTDYLPVFATSAPTLEEIFKMKVGEEDE